jgi:hypothetical protein
MKGQKMKKTNSVFSLFSTSVKVEIQKVKIDSKNVKMAKGGGGYAMLKIAFLAIFLLNLLFSLLKNLLLFLALHLSSFWW